MLEMRFLRTGRRNSAFFRVVLTESSKPPKSGFIKVLGWFNPHTKESSLKKDEILLWIEKGAKPSNRLAKLLISEGIKHKRIIYIPSAKKEAKAKEKPASKPKAEEIKQEETGDKAEDVEQVQKPEKLDEEKSQDKPEPDNANLEGQDTEEK